MGAALATLLDLVRPLLPQLAIGLALLLLALLLALLVMLAGAALRLARRLWRGPAAAAADGDDGQDAGVTTLRLAGVQLQRLNSGPDGPYGVPWIALLGAARALSERLLPEPLPIPAGLSALHRLLLEGSCRPIFCRDGVVIGFDDGLLDSRRWLERWRATLRAARVSRPERPLDALVIAIDAAQLRDAGSDALVSRGEQIYQILATIQRDTGWRIPVTLLVSGCEALAGFRALPQTLPDAARRLPFGWAVPYALDTAFEPAWAREATAALVERLTLAQLAIGAAADAAERAAALLTLGEAVAGLEAPLTTLLTSALRSSAYHEAFMFRGVFLAGAAADDAAAPAAFARPAFSAKVFAEYRLAQPAFGEATRRHRRRRLAQAGFAAMAVLCGLGLLRLSNGWREQVSGVHVLLSRIAPHASHAHAVAAAGRAADAVPSRDADAAPPRDADAAPSREAADNAAAVMAAMSDLTIGSVATWAAPASLLSGADNDVRHAIARVWESSVLSAFARALQDGPIVARRLQPGLGDDAGDLDTLATRLITYDDMLDRYRAIGRTADIGDIEALVSYVFDVVMPEGFRTDYELYIDALAEVRRPRVDLAAAQRAMRQHFETALHNRYAEGRLARATALVAERLQRLAAAGADADAARTPLIDLAAALDALNAQLLAPDAAWVTASGEPPELAAALARLATAGRPDGLLTGSFVAGLRGQALAALAAARQSLLAIAMPDGTPLLSTRGGRLALADALALARPPLATLMARPFMAPPPASAVAEALPRGRRIEWVLGPLESAQGMAEAYLASVPATLRALPPALRPAVEAVAAAQLGAHVEALVRPAATPAGELASEAAALPAEAANFAAAAPLLASLRDALRQARLARPAAWLDDTATAQAGRLLAELDSRLAAAAPYQMVDPTLSFWTGRGPMAAAAFGAANIADLVSTLPPRHDYVERLARDAAAAPVAWLRDPTSRGAAPYVAMAQRWQSIIDTFDRYHRGDPTNALSLLEQFIAADIDRVAASGCAELPAASAAGGGNYFANQLQTIRYALATRCHLVTSGAAAERYRSLAADFTADLAGRVPFAAPPAAALAAGQPAPPPADPNDVRRFFQAYGAELTALPDQLPAGAEAAPARQFLHQLIAVQTALAPLLTDPSPQAALVYDVTPAFYANAAASRGLDELIELAVSCGEHRLSSRDAPGALPWIAGQPIAVALRWAANGPNLPVPPSAAVAGTDAAAGGEAGGSTVRFVRQGTWALFELLRDFAPLPGELGTLADRQPEVVAFEVRLRPNPAAATRGAGAGSARIILRLALTGILRTPGQPDRRIAIELPHFPDRAPPLLPPPAATISGLPPPVLPPVPLAPLAPRLPAASPVPTAHAPPVPPARARVAAQALPGRGGSADGP